MATLSQFWLLLLTFTSPPVVLSEKSPWFVVVSGLQVVTREMVLIRANEIAKLSTFLDDKAWLKDELEFI